MVPFAKRPSHVIHYNTYATRPEISTATRRIPFVGGPGDLSLALQYVRSDVIAPSLPKRPVDEYVRIVVIITADDVTDDDSVTMESKKLLHLGGKVFWIRYDTKVTHAKNFRLNILRYDACICTVCDSPIGGFRVSGGQFL